ncbi:hypothetical protein NLG97_g9033 [Lecanicillium saksenae]|uniref:Uncharacterized protein n=1 Tax=Lecanicillium saksenae TaxID=468837 RepID=A0ACC1QJL6_9HYPO|nr:hypothetical protein NLG97_g9033 [Lecanicillium saksenae]
MQSAKVTNSPHTPSPLPCLLTAVFNLTRQRPEYSSNRDKPYRGKLYGTELFKFLGIEFTEIGILNQIPCTQKTLANSWQTPREPSPDPETDSDRDRENDPETYSDSDEQLSQGEGAMGRVAPVDAGFARILRQHNIMMPLFDTQVQYRGPRDLAAVRERLRRPRAAAELNPHTAGDFHRFVMASYQPTEACHDIQPSDAT